MPDEVPPPTLEYRGIAPSGSPTPSRLSLAAGLVSVGLAFLELLWCVAVWAAVLFWTGDISPPLHVRFVEGLLLLTPVLLAAALGVLAVRRAANPDFKNLGRLGLTLACFWLVFLFAQLFFA